MKNLKDYNKAELINIAEQLTIPKLGLFNSKNSTLITKIEDMAEELAVSIPSPEVIIDMPVKTVIEGQNKPRRIRDYPKAKIVLEARADNVKQQYVSINEYTISIRIGDELLVPEPVIDYLESLKDTVHTVNDDGIVVPKYVSKFYVKRVK